MSAPRARAPPRGGTPRRSARRSLTGDVRCSRCAVDGDGYRVVTDRGTWRTGTSVVVATGPSRPTAHSRPLDRLDPGVHVLTASAVPQPRPAAGRAECSWSAPRPRGCRSPTSSPAPAARWFSRSGGHTRMPRRYRGMDVFWWLEQTGRLARTIDERRGRRRRRDGSRRCSWSGAAELDRLGAEPGPGHAAGPRRRLAGRLARARRPHGAASATTSGTASSDADAPDGPVPRRRGPATSTTAGLAAEVVARAAAATGSRCAGPRDASTCVPRASARSLLATGYRPHHPWLRVPGHRAGRLRSSSAAA